ncbi:hypothetical protein KBB48_02065 [Candidatus Shapirobacteria bacterium]|jgi:hypothetical protein|nr:hypothetical protein [Candidatus Shapirobacteria bacterium]
MEKNIPLKIKALVCAGLTLGGLTRCGGDQTQRPEVGDTGVARISMEGVMDYNQIKFPKDTCVIESGTVYKVIDKSTLNLPSIRSTCFIDESTGMKECYPESNKQTVLQLEGENGCVAWYPVDEVEESTDLGNK